MFSGAGGLSYGLEMAGLKCVLAVGIMAHYNVHFACEFSCVEVDVKTGKLSVSQLADTDSYSPGCNIIYKNRYDYVGATNW